MIGQTISHYKILEKLGEGGMGVVYKAEDTKLQRTVTLKFLHPELTRDPEAKKRFTHEARAAAALSHSNICTIYEIDELGDQLFIAMEYIEGQDLKEKIAAGPLKMSEALDIATQIAEGLHEAHEKSIIHRDIKPANIMMTSKAQVKIMDFGLAKLRGQTKLTKEGTTLGTVAYMSPEQTRGEEVDHRSDIWSTGAVLYEMITGQHPFKGDYEQAVMYSIINEIPEPITGLRTGVPLELERIVNKALVKKPDERYQHVDEILVDLKSISRVLKSKDIIKKPVGAKRSTSKRLLLYCILSIIFIALIIIRLAFFPGSIEHEVIDSIAVLPLENLSGDPEQEYFTDGMTEALITDLSKITSLKVISRTSAMRYKETDKSIPEIAQELDVDVLVEGSVMKVGDQVRITAQLIRGQTDEHLWAESYDRDLENVLGLLTEVAKTIAGEIEVALTQQEQENLGEVHSVNPEAHEAYLKGRYFFNKLTGEGFRKSLEYYQKAVDIDSNFALGWAGLSGVYTILGGFGLAPVDEALPQGKATALKAFELDDRIAAAHNSLGWAMLYSWDWEGAKEEFERALELNPNSATANHGYCDYLTVMGHLEEGLRYVIRGRESDPFSVIANLPVAGHLFVCRRYDEAIEESQKLLELFPNQSAIRSFLRGSYWHKGMYDEALEELKKDWVGQDPELWAAVELGIAKSGPKGAMRAVAEKLVKDSKTEYIDPKDVAIWYARAGETELTLEWLELACEQRSPLLWHSIVYPDFDHLRKNPRYEVIVKKMGLKI